MLAITNRQGIVLGSKNGIARIAQINPSEIDDAFNALLSADPDSSDQGRAPENQGRRIEAVPGGYRLLNYEYYRNLRNEDERREQNREAQARHRQKQTVSTGQPQSSSVTASQPVSHGQPRSAQAEAEADAEAEERGVVVPYSSKPEPEEDETRPPENLHPLNYARKILETLDFPLIADNMRVVAAAIQAEIRSGKSPPAAYEFVLAGTRDAQLEGYEINRFFFTDAKYRMDNRKSHGKPKKSPQQQRNDDIGERIERIFREESATQDQPAPAKRRPVR